MGMGHIERGHESCIDINDLLKIVSPLTRDACAAVMKLLDESGATFGGQDLLPNDDSYIANLLTDYDAVEASTDEEFERIINEKVKTIRYFSDLVREETGLIIGLVYADGTNGDRYDDVSDVWVWFGCNILETKLTEVGQALHDKGVHASPVRWSDYG